MAERTEKLLLLDTASLYFRAYFGVPDSVKAPDGTPVNAVRGLLDMIARLVTDHRPTRLVMCWDDDWRPQFRVDAIPSYKAHRVAVEVPGTTGVEEVPDTLSPQVPIIVEVLEALGIARVGVPGYEADDVIGTLVAREVAKEGPRARGRHHGGPGPVPAGRRRASRCGCSTRSGASRTSMAIDQAVLQEKYAVASGPGYADMAVLRGDPSDGLPGVPGIGEKTAAQLVHRYGSLDGILAARDAGDAGLTATQRRRLVEAADYLAVAPAVVRVAPDAPVGDARRPAAERRRGRRGARRAGRAVGAVVERQEGGGRPQRVKAGTILESDVSDMDNRPPAGTCVTDR